MNRMNATTASIIQDCKVYINENKLTELKEFYEDLLESEFSSPPEWGTIYHHVYIHACLRKRKDIVNWLHDIFKGMDPIVQIALRHVFSYGRALLSKE